jgi:hypothetical protein
MAESIEKLDAAWLDWEIDGENDELINGQLVHVLGDTVLGTTGEAREICQRHLRDGTAKQREAEFFKKDVVAPTDKNYVRIRRFCHGCNLLGECGLVIEQFDDDGNPVHAD